MKNLLLSAAIGDIAGSAYESRYNSTKNYDAVEMFASHARFTDDTVCTFACAEALLDNLDMADNLWKRTNGHPHAGYGYRFRLWMASSVHNPYGSYGNGSAMRCSAAGWLAGTEEECVDMARLTAMPTHNHPEGIKGAMATALAVYHLKSGRDKAYVRSCVLEHFYPDWALKGYADIHDDYVNDTTCQGTVPAALICFLESKDYVDCIKLAISLGGDADTLAAIAGPSTGLCLTTCRMRLWLCFLNGCAGSTAISTRLSLYSRVLSVPLRSLCLRVRACQFVLLVFSATMSAICLWLAALLAAMTPPFCVSFTGDPSVAVIVPPASVTISEAAA